MGVIVLNCPHSGCGARGARMETTKGWREASGRPATMIASCPRCQAPIVLTLETKLDAPFGERPPDPWILEHSALVKYWKVTSVYPEPPPENAKDAIPEDVRVAFAMAEQARDFWLFASAAIGYRRAVSLALDDLNIQKIGSLRARVQKASERYALPCTLMDLMHTVRFFDANGEDIAHDPAVEEVEAAAEFTRLFLVYTYELPAQIRAALEKRFL